MPISILIIALVYAKQSNAFCSADKAYIFLLTYKLRSLPGLFCMFSTELANNKTSKISSKEKGLISLRPK
jgi:hypothetical protein